jgi:hypothetical protein
MYLSPLFDGSHFYSCLKDGTGSDCSFSTPVSMEEHLIEDHNTEWVGSLERLNQMSLSILLHGVLVRQLQMGITESDKVISSFLGVSSRTIWEWRSMFFANEGCFTDTMQGKYTRSLLWDNEDLNEQAARFIRANASVKGKPNLTAAEFCEWVNDYLLPTSTLDNTLPQRIGLTTATRWMHELGFSVINKSKGIYIDGHERDDVVASRNRFLRKMTAIGFLRELNAPTEQICQLLTF